MEEKRRKTGIDLLGDVPWGTHFCQFYRTRGDLTDILVPYFKAGLENNELCMWITSEPLPVDEAITALSKAVDNLADYIAEGQIEILDASQWYTRSGRFNSSEVLQGWVDKEKKALEKGFDGLRLTGNIFWLESEDWDNFREYEEVINHVIGNHRMLALCSYSLERCGAVEVIDVLNNHQFGLIRKDGNWNIIESSQHKQAEEARRESEHRLVSFLNSATDGFCLYDSEFNLLMANAKALDMLRMTEKDAIGKHMLELSPRLKDTNRWEMYKKALETGDPLFMQDVITLPEFGELYLDVRAFKVSNGIGIIVSDTTNQKKAERRLVNQAEMLSDAEGIAHLGSWQVDLTTNEAVLSPEYCRIFGIEAEESGTQLFVEAFLNSVHPHDRERVSHLLEESFANQRESIKIEYNIMRPDGEFRVISAEARVTFDENGRPISARGFSQDITERKQAEESVRLTNEILQILNRHTKIELILKGFVETVKNFAGCSAVAIRLLDEKGNIPYQAHDGFSHEFYKSESPLSIKVDQCMCINVIKGIADPKHSYYTEGGSFYMNGTTHFLATVSEEEKGKTRNVCNGYGYESVALVPIRQAGEVLGLIHIADMKEDMVPLEMVETMERVAQQLGSAIQRIRAEQEVKKAKGKLEVRVEERTAELAESTKQLRALSQRLVEAHEEERRKIAKDLHDQIGQTLTMVNFLVDMALKSPPEKIQAILSEAKAALVEAVQETRDMSSRMRPVMLDDLGLLPTLIWQFQDYTEKTNIQVDFQHSGLDYDFPTDISTAAYRIVQEALTNIARHAGVNEVRVIIRVEEETLFIEIEDLGKGFDQAVHIRTGSIGLSGMKERAYALDGTLKIESELGVGTHIAVELPLPKPLEAKTDGRYTE